MSYRIVGAVLVVVADLFGQVGALAANQSIDFPFYLNADGFRSVLTLMNNSSAAIDVSITAYNRRGDSRQIRLRAVPVGSPVRINLAADLASAPNTFESGNLRCTYSGLPDRITGQISIVNARDRISFEVEEAMAGTSARLVAVASAASEHAIGMAAVTNFSTHPIQIRIGAVGDRKLRLAPRETHILNGAELAVKPGRPAYLDLQHDGLAGEVGAIGAVFDRDTGYSSTMAFTDPGDAMSNTLAAAHFYTGPATERLSPPHQTRFRAVLALANTLPSPTEAVVSVDYTLDKRAARVQIAEVPLDSGEAKEVDVTARLEALGIRTVDEAGLDVSYNGPPGGVIGALTSADVSGDLAYDTPVKDPRSGMYRSAGAHPWRLDGTFRTLVCLKNVLSTTVHAMVVLRFDSGQYALPRVTLAPFQTVSIDLYDVIAANKKDLDSNSVPAETSGKLIWLQEEPDSLIGRAEISDRSAGLSASFSCFYPCNCQRSYFSPNTTDTYLWPGNITLSYLDTALIATDQKRYDCNNTLLGTFDVSSSSAYTSDYTTIFTFTGNQVQAVGEGVSGLTSQTSRNTVSPPSCPTPSTAAQRGNGKAVRPDHLQVTDDRIGTIQSCPSTAYRSVHYQIVDINNAPLNIALSVSEVYLNTPITNTCNTGAPQPTGCTVTDSTGSFWDTLQVNCNSVGGSCGFTLQHQWNMCNSRYLKTLATLTDVVTNDAVTINGNAGLIPNGTQFR